MAKPKRDKSQPKPKKAKAKSRAKPRRDEEREERITMEIIVDAYNEAEKAMGWYCYLDEKLDFPFRARCIAERSISPLGVGDEVEVVGMASGDECEQEMFVTIGWNERTLAVPLAQLDVIHADEQTKEAVEDWHYWIGMKYQF